MSQVASRGCNPAAAVGAPDRDPKDGAVLAPSTGPRRGASLRCAPCGVTSAARGALPAAGRDEGRVALVEPRDGQAAAMSPR